MNSTRVKIRTSSSTFELGVFVILQLLAFQKEARRPNSIQRTLFVRFAETKVLVISPKVCGLCKLSPGVAKLTLLNTFRN